MAGEDTPTTTPEPAANPAPEVEAQLALIPEPAPAPTPEPAPRGPAPWDSAVSSKFADPEVAKQVSAFMAEHTQPYVTKLEQEKSDLESRALWYDDLVADPAETLKQAVTELYGDEVAAQVVSALTPQQQADLVSGAAPEAAAPAADPATTELLEWAKAKREEESSAQMLEQYRADIAPVIAANPDIPEAVLHRYVATCDGDFDAAVAAFRADWPNQAPTADPPPAVLSGGGPSGAPTVTGHTSLAAAAASVFDAAAKGNHRP